MTFRVTLFELNNFTLLLDGDAERYHHLTIHNFEFYSKNMDFLLGFLKNYRRYSNKQADYDEIETLAKQLNELNQIIIDMPFKTFKTQPSLKQALLESFRRIAAIVSNYTVKGLILPGESHTQLNRLLKEESLVNNLINLYPEVDIIMLQLLDFPKLNDITLYNVARDFEVALYQADDWPALFLWSKNRSIFLKHKTLDDLYFYMSRLSDPDYLATIQERQHADFKASYLLHLSDLHIGSKSAKTEALLDVIDQNIVKKLNFEHIYPLISGDLVDSASKKNLDQLGDYLERLKALGLEAPLTVKGNHDVYIKGMFKILKLLYRYRSFFSEEKKVEVLEDEKVIIIKFDSNEGGHFIGADGGISRKQYKKVNDELAQVPHINQYTLIAMLHHHVIHFPREQSSHRLKRTFEGYTRFRLNRYEKFIDWLNTNNVRVVLHGHRHEQHYGETGNIKIFASGSSTGKLELVEANRKHLYYNLIQIKDQKLTYCYMVYIDERTMRIRKLRIVRFTW